MVAAKKTCCKKTVNLLGYFMDRQQPATRLCAVNTSINPSLIWIGAVSTRWQAKVFVIAILPQNHRQVYFPNSDNDVHSDGIRVNIPIVGAIGETVRTVVIYIRSVGK